MFSFVANVDGETVGCVIGNVGLDRSGHLENVAVTERCDVAFSVISGYDTYISDIDIMERASRKLVDGTGEAYYSQLVFLIVSESMRGRGHRIRSLREGYKEVLRQRMQEGPDLHR